jgi:hypothetical protein
MEKGIKLASTTFRNFTKFNAIEVNYNDDISYLCGNNGAGKSSLTVLGLQACIKGIAEKDLGGNLIGSRFAFIGPIGKSADIGYRFHDQRYDRFFTITNHITQNQNDIKIEAEDGNQMPNEWLDDFLSVKLMSESHFCSLSSKDQALSLGINTMTFDDRISELKNTIAGLSRDLNKYSNTEPVERCTEINIDALQLERKAIVDEVNAKYLDNIKTNKELRAQYNKDRVNYDKQAATIQKKNEKLKYIIDACDAALVLLQGYGYAGNEISDFINSLERPQAIAPFDKKEPEYIEELPSSSMIDAIEHKIQEAYINNIKAKNYNEYLKKCEECDAIVKEQEINKQRLKDLQEERLSYIKQFNLPFNDLSINDKGELELNGRQIRKPYFSTGERIKIVAKLMMALHPLFKTVFLDNACELDAQNMESIVNDLVAQGFQVIVSIPNEAKIKEKHCIILRDCKVINDSEKGETLL